MSKPAARWSWLWTANQPASRRSGRPALAWMDIPELSARPHWARYFFDIPGIIPYIREAWGENLAAFALIRDDLDPDRVFMNPALMRIFDDED